MAGGFVNEYPRPVVYISRCITFEAVRYNGDMISSDFVESLKPFIMPITHCPEVEIGLPIPRKTLRIVADDKEMKKLRLIQPATGDDLTAKMSKWVKETLDDMPEVDGFILKSKSPSSGAYDVKIYPARGEKPAALTTKGAGFFGGEVVKRFPDKIIEDEGRLNDEKIADNFLKRIFTCAAFRRVRNVKDLINFQAANKLLFMTYNQKYMRIMGGIAANTVKRPFDEAKKEYAGIMSVLFSKIYKVSNMINTFQHAFGYFSEKLKANDKKYFLNMLEKYREGKTPVSVIISLMKSYIIRFDEKYLAQQTVFDPYPESIMENRGYKR
jgi:uncharacterized protein YbgA (DUF1722 family)/uncharacterized protein YbbK (DUF523 family)